MNKADFPQPATLVCGILYKEEPVREQSLQDLHGLFGEMDFQSEPLPFRYTDYYSEEMGEPLFRLFVSFSKLIDPAELAVIKVQTNALESKYSTESKQRRVNLDPGYLTPASYILATSKNYAHRIYLGQGIFAQQELLFQKNKTQTLDWTYPDYRSFEYQEIFKKIRQQHLSRIRTL